MLSEHELFHLRLYPESEIVALHEKIKQSGIRFKRSAFDFVPHCTIANLANDVEETFVEAISGLSFQGVDLNLSSLSVYTIRNRECILRANWSLKE